MGASTPPPLCFTPIKQRPPPTPLLRLRALSFNLFFFFWAIIIHSAQLVLPPLLLLRSRRADRAFRAGQRYLKDAFAAVLKAVNSLFGRSTFVLSSDGSLDLKKVVRRDAAGRVVGIELAPRSVWISNHSQYQDWLILWLVMTVGQIASGLCIIMKASLMWAPIVGPAMQLFSFEFISKKRQLQRPNGTVLRVAKHAVEDDAPFALLLFPEGTLFSRLTQPKSAAFCSKASIAEPENLLLPRSTGLLYSLRSLKAIVPDLVLYDVTTGYPGMKAGAYAQDYYSLQTVYGYGASAPLIRLHVQQLSLAEIPLGEEEIELGMDTQEVERRCTKADRDHFDEWLRARWSAKDKLVREFYETGKFESSAEGEEVELEIDFTLADGMVLASVVVGLGLLYKLARLAY